MEAAKAELSSLEEKLQLTEELATVREQPAETHSERAAFESSSTEEVTSLKTQIAESEQKLQALQQTYIALEGDLAPATKALEEQKQALAELEKKFKALQGYDKLQASSDAEYSSQLEKYRANIAKA